MYPIVEDDVRLGGFRTRALEVDGEGPPILLLHGFADSADTWRLALDRLRREGRRALALDTPGFGTAAHLEPGPVLPQLDGFAAAAIEYLADGEEVVVAGNSLGGSTGLRAAQNPDLPVLGVVAVAPAGLEMARWMPIIEGERLLRTLLAAPVPVPEAVVREVVGRIYRVLVFADAGDLDPGVVKAFTSHLGDRRTVTRTLEVGRRLLAELRDPFELERIDCPVLLLWGDRDRMVYPTGAERVLEAVSGSSLEVIEHCGHCPQLERPDRFVELLLDFPGELARAA